MQFNGNITYTHYQKLSVAVKWEKSTSTALQQMRQENCKYVYAGKKYIKIIASMLPTERQCLESSICLLETIETRLS